MSEARGVTVVVDAAGGDFAPGEVLTGVSLALVADSDLHVVLTGPGAVIEPFAASAGDRVTAVPTTEIIEMDEHPANAVRSKKDSSIVVGCRLVREGRADGFFSAGSTGAVMAAATLIIGRIKGVDRPAIATVLPSSGSPTVLLDVGANADCKPEHLVQFAQMGGAYASTVLGVVNPKIALLNIGEEPTKGSQLAQDSYVLMAERVADFVGNIEGRELLTGAADVVVTDGFTGNVVLKTLEGTSKMLLGEVKKAMTSSLLNKSAAALLRPSLSLLRDRLNPDAHGGAPLLGVSGVCIIGHGSSSAQAVSNGIGVAAQAVRGGLTSQIAESMTGVV